MKLLFIFLFISFLSLGQSIQVPVAGLTAGSYIVAVATEGVSFNQHVVIK